MSTLDVITIGRRSVDLYGAQIGGRLEDMGSFDNYIGGSPTNIACGAARLGLRAGVITRVGDEAGSSANNCGAKVVSTKAWQNTVQAIERNDPHTRGIVALGLDAPESELATSFGVAARFNMVKGFAVGRTIFGHAARNWLTGGMIDAEAAADMAIRFRRLCDIWDAARARAEEV